MKNLNPQLLHRVTRELLGGKAKVTQDTWKESLEGHPQYPSMQSLSDTLHRWGFDNAALRLIPEQLAELPHPFIAHFRDEGGKFIGVLDRKKDQFRITDGLKESWVDMVTFEKSWSGAILLVEPKEKNGDPEYFHKRNNEILQKLRLPVLFSTSASLILFTLLVLPAFSIVVLSYAFLSIVGLALSTALVSLHVDGKGSPARRLCQTSDTTDCHSILDSPAAKLFGLFSWAELGMLYFGFQLVALLIGVLSQQLTSTLGILAGLGLLAVLYVPYSIYYQAQVVCQWCRFCLGVQAVLTLQASLSLVTHSFSFNVFSVFPYTPFVWGVALPVLIWLIVKPLWIESIKGKEVSRNLRRFQSNEKLFADMLASQEAVPPIPRDMPVLRYGNPEAANTLTVVTNPFCGPCAQMHERIDKLLAANPFVKIETIVLTGDDPNEKRARLAALWLALQEKGQDVQMAMKRWYKLQTKDIDSYAQGINDAVDEPQMEKVMTSSEWVNKANINATPTVLLNGRRFPEPFQVEDLSYLLINVPALEMN
jgi:uncharacterized membrane protein